MKIVVITVAVLVTLGFAALGVAVARYGSPSAPRGAVELDLASDRDKIAPPAQASLAQVRK